MCFLPAQHGCRGRPGTATWAGLTPPLHLLMGTVLSLYYCLIFLFFGCFGFCCFFFTFPSPPFQTPSLRTAVEASPTQVHPCSIFLQSFSRTRNYSLKQAMTSFQMIFLKWAGPRKFSLFPSHGGTSLWKIPQPGTLVSRGGKGAKGELGWCLNL